LFLIVKELHHLNKAMGKGRTSPCNTTKYQRHQQCDKPTTTLATQRGNGNGEYLLVGNVQHDGQPIHHLQGDSDGGSTSTKHL
jgi:hypothetical protein